MMRKIIVFLLCGLLFVTATGCGSASSGDQGSIGDLYAFDIPKGWEQAKDTDQYVAADGNVDVSITMLEKSPDEGYQMPEGITVSDPVFPDVMMDYLRDNLQLDGDYDQSTVAQEKNAGDVEYFYASLIITSDEGMSYTLLNVYDYDEDNVAMVRFDYEEGSYEAAKQCSQELNATLHRTE